MNTNALINERITRCEKIATFFSKSNQGFISLGNELENMSNKLPNWVTELKKLSNSNINNQRICLIFLS